MVFSRVASALALLSLCAVAAAARPPKAPPAPEKDPRVAWLRDHAVELATIDPAAPGFADLEPLKKTLAGVRVVLLGEATRGDGSTLLAKDRLIRFLHEEMGFGVLVLDCGFYRCGRGGEAVRSAPGAAEAKRALVEAMAPMRLYTESAQLQPLLDYVVDQRSAERPLLVAGADPELSGDGSALIDELERMLRREGTDAAGIPGFEDAATIVRGLGRGAYTAGEEPMPSAEARTRFTETLEAIRDRLHPHPAETGGAEATAAASPSPEELAFWRQVLDNLGAQARMTWKLGVYRPGHGVAPDVTTLVNRQTADNLLWLAERRFPGRKIVVSTRTVFLARHLSRLETGDLDTKARFERFTTVGDLLEEELGDQAYIVGFTAFEGRAGTPFHTPHPLLEPTPGSFEDLMAQTGLEAAFVDLRGLRDQGRQARWLSRPLIARPLSFKELRGSWPRHLDAFIFLRTMEPSHLAGPLSP